MMCSMSTPVSTQPITAGVVTALVGFTSSFTVVLAGLAAVGATGTQAASGLLVLCVTQGIGTIAIAMRYRIPVTLAWSTPGAALLAGIGIGAGGWPAAVGAFLAVGVAIICTGLSAHLGRLIARIPTALAQAMLAGVLLPLCLAPVTALRDEPWAIAPVVAVWLVVLKFAPRWAVPVSFVAATGVIAFSVWREGTSGPMALLPVIDLTAPAWTWQAMVSIAVPLYIVTMASQNIPGVAVMKSFSYDVPWRSSMLVTGIGTTVGAPAGGHAINLAAISAALAAGPEAGPDRDRRWIASATAGWSYLVLALFSTAVVTLVALAPAGVVETVAALALLGILGSALAAAMKEERGRESAVVTLVIAASGITIAGIGAAFWALVAGVAVRMILQSRGARGGT